MPGTNFTDRPDTGALQQFRFLRSLPFQPPQSHTGNELPLFSSQQRQRFELREGSESKSSNISQTPARVTFLAHRSEDEYSSGQHYPNRRPVLGQSSAKGCQMQLGSPHQAPKELHRTSSPTTIDGPGADGLDTEMVEATGSVEKGTGLNLTGAERASSEVCSKSAGTPDTSNREPNGQLRPSSDSDEQSLNVEAKSFNQGKLSETNGPRRTWDCLPMIEGLTQPHLDLKEKVG